MSDASDTPHYSRDILAQARRRRLGRVMLAAALGIVVAAYTYGALAERTDPEEWNDLLPQWLEALVLGTMFAAASLPIAGAILARAIIPVPTFLLYLTVLLGKNPPLPYAAAFLMALIYAGALTALSTYLAQRPERSKLGSRH
ncbi:MAG TPA: hypothetical protein VFK49_02490 [Stellaceae bacterium]|nr:hypothetical protein [Stellaceae bacterium]